MSVAELSDTLDLGSIRHRSWHVQDTTAIDGLGLETGFAWYARSCLVTTMCH